MAWRSARVRLVAEEAATHAVVVLVDDDDEAATVADVIRDLAYPRGLALIPPVRGAGFFADPKSSAELDLWWRDNIPPAAKPVYVLDFSPSVVSWIAGLDGHFIIRHWPPEIAVDAAASVESVDASSPLELAGHVLQHLAVGGAGSADDAAGLVAFAEATRPHASPPAATPSTASNVVALVPPAHITEKAEAPYREVRQSGLPTNRKRRSIADFVHKTGFLTARSVRADRPADDVQLARSLARRAGTIVAVPSRAGGDATSSLAVGLAIAVGSVLNAIGRRAVLVDANPASSEAWSALNVSPAATTVRDVIEALTGSNETSSPAFASTPALACYPEAGHSSEHARDGIRLLASHLRRVFTLAIIDVSHRLPDSAGPPEAAAAAFWLEVADVVVLPTGWSKQEFNAVLDYLALHDVPPAVVAYMPPRARRHREHPLTQRYVDTIALRACSIVELPSETDNVRNAETINVPATATSRQIRAGYRSLIQAVVRAAEPRRRP